MSNARNLARLLPNSSGKLSSTFLADGLAGKKNGISSNGAIPASYVGGYVYIDGTSTAVSLPKVSTVTVNGIIVLENTTPALTVTISTFSGDNVFYEGNHVTSFVLPYKAKIVLIADQTSNYWNVISRDGYLIAPSYASGSGCGLSSWIQAPSDGFVTVLCQGAYMNGCQVYAGSSTSNYTRIGFMGDDINNNTKSASFSFAIKGGSYFYVDGGGYSGGFETIIVTFWPSV